MTCPQDGRYLGRSEIHFELRSAAVRETMAPRVDTPSLE